MKKLSDYKGEEALELWGDLLDPIAEILADSKVANLVRNHQDRTWLQIAKDIIKWHKAEIMQVFKTIDPDEEIDGLNIIMKLANILAEVGRNAELRSFFGFAEQGRSVNEPIGSAMANTGEEGH